MRKVDLNERIVNGRLTQIGQSFKSDKFGTRSAVFQCECGNKTIVIRYGVISGTTSSCGCFQRESLSLRRTSHGHKRNGTESKTYKCWRTMLGRCFNKNNASYDDYGGRGITVCDRWLNSFENFLDDMGESPEGMSLDRFPNNNGNYEPENCRWATVKEQHRNTRANRMLTYNNVTKCAAELAEDHGISGKLLLKRLALGWSLEKALTTKSSRKAPIATQFN